MPEEEAYVQLERWVVFIHRVAEKAHSRKPAFIHPHTYTVPGRRQAGLFSELPRRVLLGNPLSNLGARCLTPSKQGIVENGAYCSCVWGRLVPCSGCRQQSA